MNINNIPESNQSIPTNALSIYNQNDQAEEFPVLKAFQQYIDAEQNKARKRMLLLSIFFSMLMTLVVAVFLMLLRDANNRNQSLNDRLVEFAMKDRENRQAAVVVQPPAPVDNSAVLGLTAKIEEMQAKLLESQRKIEEAAQEKNAADLAVAAAKKEEAEKASAQEIEILKLKTLLAEQKAKAAEESELRKQAQLEAYRLKQYPELYAPKKPQNASEIKEDFNDVSEDNAINYFDEEEKNYSIPVEVKGSSSKWRIPNY